MKIHKPQYDSVEKLYKCAISDGFRFSVSKEDGCFKEDLEVMKKETAAALVPLIIAATKGWFSKPLIEEWLSSRIRYSIPTSDIADDFEGTVEYLATALVITKDQFLFECPASKVTPTPPVVIEFQEDEPPVVELSDLHVTSLDLMSIGPTRRILQKEAVMIARKKAARALFTAEHLTHEYVKVYGEDTEWEDDSDEDS